MCLDHNEILFDCNHLNLQENAARDFRPSCLHMDGSMQSISIVLCNDKPQTFGAPDVLRVSIDQMMVKYVMEQHFHDRPPDQVCPSPC